MPRVDRPLIPSPFPPTTATPRLRPIVGRNGAGGHDPEASASCRARLAALLLTRDDDLIPEAARRPVTWVGVEEDRVAFARAILDEVAARAGGIAGANGKARREPGLD